MSQALSCSCNTRVHGLFLKHLPGYTNIHVVLGVTLAKAKGVLSLPASKRPLRVKKSTLTLSTKYRYYGYLYLRVFYDGNTRYRDKDTIFRFINTVGDYLYPLENYFRPVSQFSVFAQFQKLPFILNGWEFKGVLDYRISDRFINTLTLETITLWPYIVDNKKTLFTYIYYTNMFSYQPDPKLLISFVITNKMMGLDASYHAHYMTVTPFMGISFWKKCDYSPFNGLASSLLLFALNLCNEP